MQNWTKYELMKQYFLLMQFCKTITNVRAINRIKKILKVGNILNQKKIDIGNLLRAVFLK